MRSLLFISGILYYLMVIAAATWAWAQTGSGWSFLLLLGLFPSFRYREGSDLVPEIQRAINVLHSDGDPLIAEVVLAKALHENGYPLQPEYLPWQYSYEELKAKADAKYGINTRPHENGVDQ